MVKRNIIKCLVAVLSLTFVVAGCSKKEEVKDEKVITVASSNSADPYSYVDNGEHKGFEVDMWKEIGKRSGYKIKMEPTGFSSIFGMLDSGKVDVAANFFGMSKERLEKYDASIPYGSDSVCIAVKDGNNEINKLEDLKGKVVAVSEGSQGQQVAASVNKDNLFEEKVYGDGTNGLQDLDLGRVSAWIDAEFTVVGDAKKANMKVRVLDEKLSVTNIAYFFKKNDEKSKTIKEDVNKAIEEMLSDGTVKKISEKWFGMDVSADIQK
ncbi:TPA: amino acid ABC transporter substrate-binding protein [Clostridioides difficile]|nr:amino acid ABC transporter substrate-binding protein [Clostridioides difficile]HBF8533670.1 amino acid ABC transporter substrate-binding protein [Clostridioides difficile]